MKLVPLPGGRSHVWTQFGFKIDDNGLTLNKKQVHCRVCNSVIAYSDNTTNLKSHLQTCTSTKSSLSSGIQTYFKVYTSKLSVKSDRSKELTKGLMTFVIKDLKPISIVDGEGFREFMHIAVPEYIVPCRMTITRQIDEMAKVERENLKEVLKNIPNVCLTVDFWTSMANNNYLGITCHFLDNWTLRNRILETVEVPESHTSDNITKNLQSVMQNWKIEHKVCAIVSDNASNMVKAIRDLDQDNLIRCTAHSIQLSVNTVLQNESVKLLTNKLRAIVAHFNRSSSA
ncbi:zinc finger BED domain-containing protein 1-like [Myzus persicae]|uniref:zinc finger BED domain-containing protein 1-like n=1 Tax=Myzus persicae TaxID=13164 RepID=UPI000B930546|nr:zinc finger BED domain-containing protein 1-like [Myzus persicae]